MIVSWPFDRGFVYSIVLSTDDTVRTLTTGHSKEGDCLMEVRFKRTYLDSRLLRLEVPLHGTTLICIKPDKQLSFWYSLHLLNLFSSILSLDSPTKSCRLNKQKQNIILVLTNVQRFYYRENTMLPQHIMFLIKAYNS